MFAKGKKTSKAEAAAQNTQPKAADQPGTAHEQTAANGPTAASQPKLAHQPSAPDPPVAAPEPVATTLTADQVMNALKAVTDPEIGLDIVELGLVYGVDISPDGKGVTVSLTLTSPMCPYGPQLVGAAQSAVAGVPGVEDAKITLVWVPRWDPREHASEDAKAFLGIW